MRDSKVEQAFNIMVKHSSVRMILMILIVGVALAGCAGSATVAPPTPTAAVSNDSMPPYQPTISIPPDLNLKGTLILSDFHRGIFRLDLATRTLTHIFNPPPDSFLSSAVLSPDGRTFVLVYSPPHDIADPLYGVSSLFTLPADGSGSPQPLFAVQSGYYYFSPSWSPDGQSLYYGRLVSPPVSGTPSTEPTGYFLTRYTLPNGPAQDLLRNILSVRLSADGGKLVYISLDPSTTLSNIVVAQPDGSSPKNVLQGGENWIVDSLAVAPDGKSIVFSSADSTPPTSSMSWWKRLLGGDAAQAHAVPSDLWIMKLGETPRQLTDLANNAFIEDFSPDGQSIIFSCGNAIYFIRPDGTGLTPIVSEPVFGSLQWLP